MRFFSITIFAFCLIFLNSCAIQKNNNTIFWVSGSKTEASAGAGKMMVLNVHRGENLENPKWENFYAPIEGFQFEEGVLQKIQVKETQLDPAKVPADASSIKYELVKVLEKKKDMQADLNGDWILAQLNGGPINRMVKVPTALIHLSKSKISGFGGCNSYYAEIKSVTDKGIKLGNIIVTTRACLEKNIEYDYEKALGEISTYEVKDGKLFFYNASGKNVLMFIRKNN